MKNMKYEEAIRALKTVADVIQDPSSVKDKLGISEIFQLQNNNSSNEDYEEDDEDIDEEVDKSIPVKDDKSYNNNKRNDNNDKQQDNSSNPQGVIDSIAQELTPVRLQQAIILSEIVGKPRSKTRKKRRF